MGIQVPIQVEIGTTERKEKRSDGEQGKSDSGEGGHFGHCMKKEN
jgi:hypothetical protein